MIDINLVPEQYRKKRRAAAIVESVGGLPKEVMIGLVGAFTFLLVIVFLIFQGYVALRVSSRNDLKRQLAAIDKEKQNVENVIKEMKSLKDRA
ncbi:MAG: hypothetical protein IT395_00210, partial [Candidatus Omnitrophica bacterium]|nr:hypothetical protein [Candidatus Omnitrophota bacterium]